MNSIVVRLAATSSRLSSHDAMNSDNSPRLLLLTHALNQNLERILNTDDDDSMTLVPPHDHVNILSKFPSRYSSNCEQVFRQNSMPRCVRFVLGHRPSMLFALLSSLLFFWLAV